MHAEVPEKAIRSLRDFASHYAMIVLSILTALSLEQVAVSIHHRSEARIAKAEIEQEIRENQRRVSASTKEVDETLKIWRGLMKKAVEQLKSNNSSKAERLELLREAARNYKDGLPSLRTNAWDAAIANQSIHYLDQVDLKRYSELYSTQKFVSQTVVSLALDGTVGNLSNIAVALSAENVEPLESVRILDWRVRTLSMIQSSIGQLNKALAEAASAE